MWPVLRHEDILRLQQQPKSATSTISTNQEESRTMRSAETQTELLDCESSSSCGEGGGGDEDIEKGSSVRSGMEGDAGEEVEVQEEVVEDDDDEEEEDSLGEESKLKSIKRLGCSNLFNFNKLELLNERGPQLQHQISDSSRNLCEHEVHVAIDDDLTTTTTTGEGKRTTMAMRTAVLGGGGDDSGSCSSIVFIQESPEVIL